MIMMQAIGEIKEANKSIAGSMDAIKENLKTLNDNNVLHDNNAKTQQQTIVKKIEILTSRYWWLILGLLAAVFTVMGYQELLKFI